MLQWLHRPTVRRQRESHIAERNLRRQRRAVHVGIKEPDSVATTAQVICELEGDGRLANATLAR